MRNFAMTDSSECAMKFSFLSRALLTCAVFSTIVLPMNLQIAQAKEAKPAARLAASDARLAKLENLLLDYVNSARAKAGLKALTLDTTLSEIARAHSAEMRDKNYFAHESPTAELRNPLDRYVLGTRSTPRLVAENIFRSWSSGRREIKDSEALAAHNSLMNSPGHKANILRNGPTKIGIGFVANDNGDLWVTQMFSKP